MGFEIVVFGILTFLMFVSGIAKVFHYRPKEKASDRVLTTSGLISLLLGTVATYYLLQLGGVI